MSGIFKIKFLGLGLLLASPPMAAWALRGGTPDTDAPLAAHAPPAAVAPEQAPMKVPVEVVTKDGKKEWVMVEFHTTAIPEPGSAALLMLSSLLLLRRQRGK